MTGNLHGYKDIFYALTNMDDNAIERFRVELGQNLRRARRQVDLTQQVMGRSLGVDQPQISKWERGKGLPSLLQLVAIALVCRKRPETLIEGIIAPTREQLLLGLDAQTSRLLYEITSLVARGAADKS